MDFRPVPSHPRFSVADDGRVIGPSGKQLNPFPDKHGYPRMNIYLGDRRWKQVGVHALVCEAFHGPRPPGAHVAHIDGRPGNVRADNLRWSAPWQNEADKRIHGTALLGERHHQAKLTEAQVREIRQRRASGEQGNALAREFGVTPTAICSIIKRKTWAHLQ